MYYNSRCRKEIENMKKPNFVKTIILALVTAVFSALVCLIDKAAIGPNETVVGFAKINGLFAKLFKYSPLLYMLTNLLGYFALLVCAFFGFIGLLQLIKGKSLKKVDRNIIALGVLYVIVIGLYVLFDKVALNYRPILMEGETNPEPSFPSSHTMLAVTVFCSAPLVLKRYFRDPGEQMIIKAVCYSLAAIMTVGRLISGVHWFTDIVAAVLISLTLVSAFKNVLIAIKPKKNA